jgi:hypothetical protein
MVLINTTARRFYAIPQRMMKVSRHQPMARCLFLTRKTLSEIVFIFLFSISNPVITGRIFPVSVLARVHNPTLTNSRMT